MCVVYAAVIFKSLDSIIHNMFLPHCAHDIAPPLRVRSSVYRPTFIRKGYLFIHPYRNLIRFVTLLSDDHDTGEKHKFQ